MPKVVQRKFRIEAVPAAALDAPGLAPIIVDFSRRAEKRRASFIRPAAWLLLCLAGVAASAGGYFFLNDQLTRLQTMQQSEAYFVPAAPVQEAAQEPALPPIPHEALGPEAVKLLPLLKSLPVGKNLSPAEKKRDASKDIRIVVDRDDGQGSYNRLVGQAAEDAALGKNESAIKHYSAALRLAPEDNASAYNLVALLLQKAALYDAQRDWVNAAKTYEKALRLWGENDQTAAAIRTRLDWVKQKQRAASIEAEKAD